MLSLSRYVRLDGSSQEHLLLLSSLLPSWSSLSPSNVLFCFPLVFPVVVFLLPFPPRLLTSSSRLVTMIPPVQTFPTAVHFSYVLFALPLFVSGLLLEDSHWMLLLDSPRVTDVLTLTKGYSPRLHASQVPPPPPHLQEPWKVLDLQLTEFAIFLGKTFRLPWDLQLRD